MKNNTNQESYFCCNENIITFLKENSENIKTRLTLEIPAMEERYLIKDYSSFAIIFSLIFDAILIFFAIKYGSSLNTSAALYFAISSSLKLFNFIHKSFMLKFGNSNWKKTARIHAAIHMVLNAKKSKDIMPTFEEVKSASYLLNECKSFYSVFYTIWPTFFLISSFFTNEPFPILIAHLIFLVLLFILKAFDLFKYMQILIISRPTISEIKYVLERFESLEMADKLFS